MMFHRYGLRSAKASPAACVPAASLPAINTVPFEKVTAPCPGSSWEIRSATASGRRALSVPMTIAIGSPSCGSLMSEALNAKGKLNPEVSRPSLAATATAAATSSDVGSSGRIKRAETKSTWLSPFRSWRIGPRSNTDANPSGRTLAICVGCPVPTEENNPSATKKATSFRVARYFMSWLQEF